MKGKHLFINPNRKRLANLLVLLVLALTSIQPMTAWAQSGQWWAEFFPNTTLTGPAIFTRSDNRIDFNWGGGAPAAGVPADNFSVRWTRTEWFNSGTYRFSYRSDDGFRLWVGNLLVVDSWIDQQGGWQTRDVFIGQGTYQVRAEYYENTGGALVTLAWEGVSSSQGWKASYYDNKNLNGDPVKQRTDANIDFDWGKGSPSSAVPVDKFSARWKQTLGFTAGTYRFYASADDGVRVWVDNQLIIDAWINQKMPNTHTGDRLLTEGLHDIKVEYFDNDGKAEIHFRWERLDSSYTGWKGEYFNNRDLAGSPALVRDDQTINFDWGTGSPVSWIAGDNFSARWTRQLTFSPGYYRFSVQSDDGVRVWLNNGLVIDKWQNMAYELNTTGDIYLTGLNQLKVEYFEAGGYARIQFWFSPTSTPLPTPAPPSSTGSTWYGEYYNNATLSGNPTLIRNESAVNFDWGWNSPAAGINADRFSARWTQTVQNMPAGTYRFTMTVDDGGRLWVNNQLVIDVWRIQAVSSYTADVTVAGGPASIKMEYYENDGLATARLNWNQPAGTTTPAQTAPGGTVLVEDNSPGFMKGGTASAWRTVAQGSGGRLLWTYNNDYSRSGYNWARWYPDLAPGKYEVFVYIPAGYSTTTNARYWVRHAEGYSLRKVSQSDNQGKWVSLGTYSFAGNDNEYVSLSDITYETYLSKMVVFDATKWEPR
ncbi:MAG: hypothetical protein JXA42_15545 [Anaerolineales bacterium]|nr:hypothetical protein [Anaerolineales bacterium]